MSLFFQSSHHVDDVVLPPSDQQFPTRVANLLHVCPDDAILEILQHLSMSDLCALRLVSSSWSPSRLANHDRLWNSFWAPPRFRLTRITFSRRDEIENGTFDSTQSKCIAFLKIVAAEKERREAQRREREERERLERAQEMEKYARLRGDIGCYLGREYGSQALSHLGRIVQAQRGDTEPSFKCVSVGDGAVGKTCQLMVLLNDAFPEEYVPTVIDWTHHYSDVLGRDEPVDVVLVDVAGEEDYDELRPLNYPDTHVFLLCFSVVDPLSLENVYSKWLPEVLKHRPSAALILVGTKADLREDDRSLHDLKEQGKTPVSREEGEKAAKELHVQFYCETSAKRKTGMEELMAKIVYASVIAEWPELALAPLKKRCGVM